MFGLVIQRSQRNAMFNEVVDSLPIDPLLCSKQNLLVTHTEPTPITCDMISNFSTSSDAIPHNSDRYVSALSAGYVSVGTSSSYETNTNSVYTEPATIVSVEVYCLYDNIMGCFTTHRI